MFEQHLFSIRGTYYHGHKWFFRKAKDVIAMCVGKKVESRDSCETWKIAKLVHVDWEKGGMRPWKGVSRGIDVKY